MEEHLIYCFSSSSTDYLDQERVKKCNVGNLWPSDSSAVLFSIPLHFFSIDNTDSQYLDKGEVYLGQKADNDKEIQSDSKTSFFILLAIFFPSVTGWLNKHIVTTFSTKCLR